MASVEELKDALRDNLDRSGTLSKIKSRIRADIFKASMPRGGQRFKEWGPGCSRARLSPARLNPCEPAQLAMCPCAAWGPCTKRAARLLRPLAQPLHAAPQYAGCPMAPMAPMPTRIARATPSHALGAPAQGACPWCPEHVPFPLSPAPFRR